LGDPANLPVTFCRWVVAFGHLVVGSPVQIGFKFDGVVGGRFVQYAKGDGD
jgi:hypothetical protein